MAQARIILRYCSPIAFVFLLLFVLHIELWLRITLATFILLPLVVTSIRSYQFYKRNIKNGQRYN